MNLIARIFKARITPIEIKDFITRIEYKILLHEL